MADRCSDCGQFSASNFACPRCMQLRALREVGGGAVRKHPNEIDDLEPVALRLWDNEQANQRTAFAAVRWADLPEEVRRQKRLVVGQVINAIEDEGYTILRDANVRPS